MRGRRQGRRVSARENKVSVVRHRQAGSAGPESKQLRCFNRALLELYAPATSGNRGESSVLNDGAPRRALSWASRR